METNNRLMICRKERGYTQAEIASVLNVNQSAYSHYEHGRRDIGTNALCKLADFYGCTTDELLGSQAWHDRQRRKEV